MVNANIIISVSAVLVAVILTIVFVMRKNGDPADNFSVSVGGTIDGKPAGMYYCIGEACQFYGALSPAFPNFPGYFALVGVSIEGITYLTEHSIGKSFSFDSTGKLLDCIDSQEIETSELSARLAGLKAANAGDGTYTIDGQTFTMSSYSLSKDPASDSPKVLGFAIPTIEECKAIWRVPGVDFVPSSSFEVGARSLSSATDPVLPVPSGWKSGVAYATDATWTRVAAQLAYQTSGNNAPATHNIWDTCTNANANARFIFNNARSTMALSFAGSNDAWDFIQDASMIPVSATDGISKSSKVHMGFKQYVDQLHPCLTPRIQALQRAGIKINVITGHSLGAAAATLYKSFYGYGYFSGLVDAVVDTWAGPRTNFDYSCRQPGLRRFDEYDPVTSAALIGFSHDVKQALAGRSSQSCGSWSWYGRCLSAVDGARRVEPLNGDRCAESASLGWDFLPMVMYRVDRHFLTNYAKYAW